MSSSTRGILTCRDPPRAWESTALPPSPGLTRPHLLQPDSTCEERGLQIDSAGPAPAPSLVRGRQARGRARGRALGVGRDSTTPFHRYLCLGGKAHSGVAEGAAVSTAWPHPPKPSRGSHLIYMKIQTPAAAAVSQAPAVPAPATPAPLLLPGLRTCCSPSSAGPSQVSARTRCPCRACMGHALSVTSAPCRPCDSEIWGGHFPRGLQQ